MAARIETIKMAGPGGILEGILRIPPEPPARAALLCHPHPLYQGSMHSPVIYRAAKAFHRRGFATLRFNFRGVGRSTGGYSGGVEEKDDVRAALDTLVERCPDLPVTLLGYSFGARVGLEGCGADPRVDGLVGIGLPLTLGSFDFLKSIAKPLWVVQGDRDEYGAVGDLQRLMDTLGERALLRIVPGADHLFTAALEALEETLYEVFAG